MTMLRSLTRLAIVGGGMLLVAALTYIVVAIGLPTAAGIGSDGRGTFAVIATGVLAFVLPRANPRLRRLASRWVFGHRVSPLDALTATSRRLSQAGRTTEALAEMASVVAAGTGALRCAVSLRVEGELVEVASYPADGDPTAADWSMPVTDGKEVVGVITVTTARPLTATERALVRDVAVRAGVALRNARLLVELDAAVGRTEALAIELAEARRALVARQDAERHAIERTLHDEAQQYLVALLVTLQRAARTAAKDAAGSPEDAGKVATLLAEADRLHREVTEMLAAVADDVEPWSPATVGIEAALRAHTERLRLPVQITVDGALDVDDDVAHGVYYACLEAIHNALKHGRPTSVAVNVRRHEDEIAFAVRDDGAGFDPEDGRSGGGGTGLTGMARRLEMLGGTLSVQSRPGEGTLVTGRMPLDRMVVPA